MKPKNLKRTGLVLILAGMAGVVMTAVGMSNAYKTEASDSAPAFAEAISDSLLPATIGTPLVLAGLILALLGWWRGRGRSTKAPRLITP